MQKYVVTDTGYWLGLIDETDEHHDKSIVINSLIKDYKIIFPFPCLYEILRTKFVRSKSKLSILERLMNESTVDFIDDTNYKNLALVKVYEQNKFHFNSHSLVDTIIREMIGDINLRMDYLVTFNSKDFADICAIRGIEIIDS